MHIFKKCVSSNKLYEPKKSLSEMLITNPRKEQSRDTYFMTFDKYVNPDQNSS